MSTHATIRQVVAETPFVDTHEHIIEESTRLSPTQPNDNGIPCDDWAYLLVHYSRDDLASAGMPNEDLAKFFGRDLTPQEKWRLVDPYYQRVKHTGYIQAVRLTCRLLFDVDDLDESTVDDITDGMRALARKGYYRHVLRDVANVETCQVNSGGSPFCETEYPDLLNQDLSTVGLSTGIDLDLAEAAGVDLTCLRDWHAVIGWHFETYGPRAIAVKNQSAYVRRLNYEPVTEADAAPIFERLLRDRDAPAGGLRPLQDHLFHYCLARAIEFDLPIKLHTGYYAGTNSMPMARLRQNAGDLSPVMLAYPAAKFVLMHIGYPYQGEYIALAKQHTNVTVDMCWAWIISPEASVRFLKEFIVTAPANKVLTFGGDYRSVESSVGHAAVARQGIAQALTELVDEGWLTEQEAVELAPRLLRGNAHELFDIPGTLAAWG